MISFCQFGAGRIGAIHAANIAAHPDARLNTIVDTDRAAAQRLVERYGAVLRGQAEALADPAVRSGLSEVGYEVFPRERQTPDALAALQKADAAKWWPVIRELGLKAE